MKQTRRVIALTIVGAVAVVSALVVVANQFQPDISRAHEDGTVHIHPTLTPTPTPTPTPLPPVGLDGPLSLDKSMHYDQENHELEVVSRVNNPPPDGWEFQGAEIRVDLEHQDWSGEVRVYTWQDSRKVVLNCEEGALYATIPIPE